MESISSMTFLLQTFRLGFIYFNLFHSLNHFHPYSHIVTP